jgi:hypothetical protein
MNKSSKIGMYVTIVAFFLAGVTTYFKKWRKS